MLGPVLPRSGFRLTFLAALALSLAACGGGSAEDDATPQGASTAPPSGTSSTTSAPSTETATPNDTATVAGDPVTIADGASSTDVLGALATPAASASAKPQTMARADAYRLLTQATFGPSPTDLASAMSSGAAAWVDAQLAQPATSSFVVRWDADNAAVKALNPGGSTDGTSNISQFYFHAINGKDQLRQRVAYALSQIMVTSMQMQASSLTRTSASYLDMLNRDAFANYRTLIQDVALHPAMGMYLSTMHNAKENAVTGQMPDQNFAREVMQLMSIGLVQLNVDGTRKLNNGLPIETYGTTDIIGMSKVFSGWSWAGADTSNDRFWGGTTPANQDVNRLILPMQGYPQYHSTSEKDFLGTVVPAQQTPNPAASLKAGLDTIFKHPNVGPFISRQLIQRLVESNPSSAYVGRVAAVFNDNGKGVRGDLKAVARAILLDAEARSASGDAYGKVREPVLRLTAWMRAFNARSDSGRVLMWATDDPIRQLAQSPLRSNSVFNFYRPGYVAPGSETGARGLTVPELQITNETTVAGYINFMTGVVSHGVGQMGATRLDVQPDYTPELALVGQSTDLVNDVTSKLIADGGSEALKSKIRTAVDSIVVPALRSDGSNASWIATLNNNRVYTAVLLTVAAPEYIVQK